MQKVDILAIGAHPDDVELSCSGTLLSHIHQGKTVGLVDLTRGELGTRGSAEIRTKEANDSAALMGASFRVNLDMPDGFFQHSRENMVKIARVIRQSQPSIVLANATVDRHPDHGKGAKLIADACFIAGLLKVPIQDENGNLLDRWRPDTLYHYIQDNHQNPDFVFDITDFIEQKFELILTFRSQFYDPDSNELDSPISGQDFLDFLRAKGRVFGRPAGFEYAEGFIKSRWIGVDNLFNLK